MKKKIVAWFLLFAMMIALVPAGSVQAATYKKGSNGTKVKYLQQNLSFLGFSTKGADGKFGGNTQKAVINAQKVLQLPQTGEVNEELYTLISETVSGIQTHLKNKGYYSGKIDGIAETGTQTAFEKIQRDYGYARTGIADRYVLTEMVNDVEKSEETRSLREWVARLNGAYDDTLESEYYTKYGEEYLNLFREYPNVLQVNLFRDDQFSAIALNKSHAMKVWTKEFAGIDKDVAWTVIKDGVVMIVDEFLSLFNLSKNSVEAIHYDAIMAIVQEMYLQENTVVTLAQETENAFKGFEKIYSTGKDTAKAVLIEELAKRSSALSWKTMEEIVDSALGEHVKSISRFLDEGVTVVDYLVTAIQMYEVDEKALDQLQKIAGKGTKLYEDIELLKKEREQDPFEFFAKKFLSETAKKAIGEALSKGTGGLYDVLTKSADLLSGLFVNASVQEQAFIAVLFEYATMLEDSRLNILIELENASYIDAEWSDVITKYELTYEATIKALKLFYENVEEISSEDNKKTIAEDIKNLEKFTYEEYIKCCIETMKKLEKNTLSTGTTNTNIYSKTQYGYYHYTNGNGEYSVCAHYGVSEKNWTNIYREEIWVDEPLTKVGSEYRHIRLEGCNSIGCLDPQWENGNKYVDANGVTWYYQKTRAVEKTTAENKNVTVIRENEVGSKPIVTPEPTTPQEPISQVTSVQDKLDYLLERLGATDGNIVYFTKDQKSCNISFVYGHGDCANCSNSNVVQTGWFKEIFGYADAGNFPKHTITKTGERNNRGYSCFGFASFAQWYLYADSCTENVKGKEIKAVKFNKDNMMAYAQPGDIVRVNGHSVVVYSVEADGMWVVDCNWDKNAAGEKIKNCVVQKHFFEYSMEKYAGKTAYINRVEKVIDGENKIGQFDINNLPLEQIPVLKTGENNLSVQYFQQNLHYLGYTIGDFDGDYGKKTSTAVKNLQKDLKMEQTGEVNRYLYCLVNDSMKEIQQYLKEKGYYSSEIDGVAGTGTSKAITKLQKEWGMSATGRVTVEFMQKIVEMKGASAVQNLAEYVKLSK